MAIRKRASQESPRSMKHLAIHVLIEMGFLVFNNIGAKNTIDLVIGVPKSGELRTAGIRIRASSYSKTRKSWYFSDSKAKYSIEKTRFFYIFCLRRENKFKPTFAVISCADLRRMTKTFRNGNYAIDISKKQLARALADKKKSKWGKYLDNFEQIRHVLEE